jgi:hypothetical protein
LRNRCVGRQFRRRARPHHLSLLDNRVPIGELNERAEMLIDDENGLALRLEAGEALPNLQPQQRRQSSSPRTPGVEGFRADEQS